MKTDNYKNLYLQAKKYFPGGVNSPARNFNSVDKGPTFIKSGKGSKLYLQDNKEYIDYCMSWGVLIFGHANPDIIKEVIKHLKKGTSYGFTNIYEIELAKRINKAIPVVEKIRFVNSGTEATMGAIRLASAYTGKKKFIKFKGSYHGSSDLLLNSENSFLADYNNLQSVENIVKKHNKEISSIIIEPVSGNMGVVIPEYSFIQGIRKICDKYKILLVFDEVITGFRINYGSVGNLFNIRPDLICFGKIIGGGFPVGAYGGKDEIMNLVAPQGDLYQAGTFSGNPITMVAGIETLKILSESSYELINSKTEYLCNSIKNEMKKNNIEIQINRIGSMFSVFFTKEKVTDYSSAKKQEIKKFIKFYNLIFNQGILFSPSCFESNFMSFAHKDEDILKTVKAVSYALRRL